MKAEIVIDDNGDVCMSMIPESVTEHTLLKLAAPKLGLRYTGYEAHLDAINSKPAQTAGTDKDGKPL